MGKRKTVQLLHITVKGNSWEDVDDFVQTLRCRNFIVGGGNDMTNDVNDNITTNLVVLPGGVFNPVFARLKDAVGG